VVPRNSDLACTRRARLEAARLYLICDSTPGGRALEDLLRPAIAGGVDIVQLREKRLGDDELARAARRGAALCGELGALFVVNDRPEIALEAGADGVHVGQEDMPVARAREVVGADLLIGLSTHTPAEVDSARQAPGACGAGVGSDSNGDNPPGVDYIGVGPVYATPTKPGREATGLDLVHYAAAHARLPFFAIGGIHAGNSAAVIEAGARGVAVVRAIAEAPLPESAARELRAALDGVDERSCFQTRPA
jgi:thiamine-phosphate pyrophosphorylase